MTGVSPISISHAGGRVITRSSQIYHQLLAIASSDDFASASARLTQDWSGSLLGVESVGPILSFMEAHPDLDYGAPGALVHFVETFFQKGYEELLTASLTRTPTPHTVWMLKRVINGVKDKEIKASFVTAMRRVAENPEIDSKTLERVTQFLARV